MVVSRTLILRRFFLAASMPFLMAAGTSLALPVPNPTILAEGSPTTTKAEKLRFLPPLTTFVTRLMDTTCSFKLSVFASMRFAVGVAAIRLKLQSCCAGGVRQGLDAPMVEIAAAVKYHFGNALLFRPLRDQCADRLGARDITAGSG